jgi:hypothetical protein
MKPATYGAVPGDQDTVAEPREGLAQRRRGEQLLLPETAQEASGMEAARSSTRLWYGT